MNPFNYRTTETASERRFTVWADTRTTMLLGLLIFSCGAVVAAVVETFAPGNVELVLLSSLLAGASYVLLIRGQRQEVVVRSDVILGTNLADGRDAPFEVPKERIERVLFGNSQRLRVLALQGKGDLYVVFNLPLSTDRLRTLAGALAASLDVPAEERTLAELWPRRRRGSRER